MQVVIVGCIRCSDKISVIVVLVAVVRYLVQAIVFEELFARGELIRKPVPYVVVFVFIKEFFAVVYGSLRKSTGCISRICISI